MLKHKKHGACKAWWAGLALAMPFGPAFAGPALAGGDSSRLALDPAASAFVSEAPARFVLAQAGEPSEPIVDRVDVETVETTEPPGLPVSFGLGYALYTDYIFRGINFSEPDHEGREKPNHQLSTSVGFDLSRIFGTGTDIGWLYFDTWYEWYAAQKKIDPERGGQNLQEVDFLLYWTYNVEPIATEVTLGYTWYLFPNLANTLRKDKARGNNNDDRTHEYWFSLAHNDAWMWEWLFPDNEDGILNPSFSFYHDVGAILGVWMDFGLSHDFVIPGLDDLTITPGYTLSAQCDYWKHGFFLAGDQWSLDATYDLTSLMHLPEWAGSVSITGTLVFFNAFGNFEGPDYNGQIRGQDEFWGGFSVDWSWGG